MARTWAEQVTTGEEHHLVISISSDGNLNTWIDGAQKLTNIDTNDLSNVGTTFEGIGATNWGDPGMNGSVNEFRIWSGELTGQEVALSNNLGPDSVVPEPSSLALLLISGLATFRRRRS
ncbi:PEP-CTERM sorting domain-containing protein [Akkermansiaceae bacterium]|nr:PEP-CTERM sorting domain-containing protein [Akkermansiaceae bacterium]